jgi:hypothetical protein
VEDVRKGQRSILKEGPGYDIDRGAGRILGEGQGKSQYWDRWRLMNVGREAEENIGREAEENIGREACGEY